MDWDVDTAGVVRGDAGMLSSVVSRESFGLKCLLIGQTSSNGRDFCERCKVCELEMEVMEVDVRVVELDDVESAELR